MGRALGASEEVYWRLDGVQPVNFVMSAEITGGIEQRDIRVGLSSAQARHPNLRVEIVEDSRGIPRTRGCGGEIPLDCSDGSREVAQRIADAESGRAFDAHVPLCRARLIAHPDGPSTLLVTLHHAVSDAKSGAFIVQDVLRAAAANRQGRVLSPQPLRELEYFEERFPATSLGLRGVWSYAKTMFRAGRTILRTGLPVAPTVDREAPLSDRKLFTRWHLLDQEQTAALCARSKERGTSVHGALLAALALAAAEDIGRDSVALACGTVVDNRNRLEPPVGEECGYFVSGIGSIHRVRPGGDHWKLARDIRSDIVLALERRMHQLLVQVPFRLHARVGRLLGARRATAFGALIEASQFPSVLLSNIGSVPIDVRYGPFTLTNLGFVVNQSVLATLNSTAATVNGQLTWCIGGMEPLLSQARTAAIADRSLAILSSSLVDAHD